MRDPNELIIEAGQKSIAPVSKEMPSLFPTFKKDPPIEILLNIASFIGYVSMSRAAAASTKMNQFKKYFFQELFRPGAIKLASRTTNELFNYVMRTYEELSTNNSAKNEEKSSHNKDSNQVFSAYHRLLMRIKQALMLAHYVKNEDYIDRLSILKSKLIIKCKQLGEAPWDEAAEIEMHLTALTRELKLINLRPLPLINNSRLGYHLNFLKERYEQIYLSLKSPENQLAIIENALAVIADFKKNPAFGANSNNRILQESYSKEMEKCAASWREKKLQLNSDHLSTSPQDHNKKNGCIIS